MRDAAGEFDDLHAADDFALGVGQHLAVLGSDDRRQFIHVPLEKLAELEQHARPAQRRRIGPTGQRRRRCGDGLAGRIRTRQRDARRHGAGRRIEDIGQTLVGVMD